MHMKMCFVVLQNLVIWLWTSVGNILKVVCKNPVS